MHNHRIPSWRSEYGASDEMEAVTDKELLSILKQISSSTQYSLTPKTARAHLHTFINIWKQRTIPREEEYLRICLHQLMEITGPKDASHFFAWLCRSQIPTIISFGIQEEKQKPFFIRATLAPGSLALPLKYYTYRTLQNTDVWRAYEHLVQTCALELGLPFLHKAMEAECEIAKLLDMSDDTPPSKSAKGAFFSRWVPEFEWNGFMEGLAIDSQWRSRIWSIDSPNRLRRILKWICHADDEKVIALFAFHLIIFASPYLRPSIKHASDALFEKALRGVSGIAPESDRFLSEIKRILPDALCEVYADQQYADQQYAHSVIHDIEDIVDTLKSAAVELIHDTTVFSRKTRAATKEKINRMKFLIGRGPSLPLPSVTYTADSVLHTILSIQSARSADLMQLTGSRPNMKHDSYPCYISNASYYEETNHIIMPWGILKWPFYCPKKIGGDAIQTVAWNYGGIGATIGHEIIHAFDTDGSLYDARGKYRDTWTRKDRVTFGKQTRRVARFFERFKHYGVTLDGERTLSENWADFGGLTVALKALKIELSARAVSDTGRREAYRTFFMAYAVSWRTLVRKEKMLYSILTSVHSPTEDRVDRIVPQFQEWVEAFDIKESDPLFLAKSQRLRFF